MELWNLGGKAAARHMRLKILECAHVKEAKEAGARWHEN